MEFSRLFFLLFACAKFVAAQNDSTELEFSKSPSDLLAEAIVHHIGERSTAIIMDNLKLGSLRKYWDTLKYSYEMGATFYVYNSFLEKYPTSAEVKPNPLKTIYRFILKEWAFVCFLDRNHSPESRDAYLRQMLFIGNGRSDVFIFVGAPVVLDPILQNSIMQKFRNVIGIDLDLDMMQVHYRESCRRTGKPVFSKSTDLFKPQWVSANENCLTGHHFRISPTDFPPFMYYIRPEDSASGTLEIHGTNYYTLKNRAWKYNYSIDVINASNPFEWPLMGEEINGTWNGVFGDLVYERAEIASVSNPTPQGNGLADFIGPFGKSSLVFMSAEPIGYATSSEFWIFQPYEVTVWLILLLGFFLVWLVNSAALKVRYLIGRERFEESYRKAFSMIMAFTFEQEVGKPKGFTLRFMMISWVCFMIILATSYRFNLLAFVLQPNQAYVPRSFQALFFEKHYRIIFDLGGLSGWTDFKNSKDPKITSLLKRTTTTTDTSKCAVDAFMSIETVCAGWDFSLTFAASKNLTIQMGPRQPLYKSEAYFETWFAFATENRSVFTDQFQTMGQSFYELGILAHWEEDIILREQYRGKRWLRERKHTPLYKYLRRFREKSKSGALEKLNLQNMEFIFIIFFTGIAISCMVLIIEFYNDGKLLRKFKRTRQIRIRKISDIVQRKLSYTLVQSGGGEEGRPKIITVTFLP